MGQVVSTRNSLNSNSTLPGTSVNQPTAHTQTPMEDPPQRPLLLSNDVGVQQRGEYSTSIVLSTVASSRPWFNSLQVIPDALVFTSGLLSNTFVHIKHLFVTPEYDKNKVSDAIEKLQSTLSFLDNKIAAMNTNVDKYTVAAKRLYKRKNKQAAIHQLRLKKMYEREVAKMDSLKFNIESNILHMESVGVMMETVSTIKETSHQFQIVSKHVDINKLEDSIDEMFEQRDTSKDIEDILNDMHNAHEFDEDELLQELETLVADTNTANENSAQQTNDRRSPPSSAYIHETETQIATMPEAPSNAILTHSVHMEKTHNTLQPEVVL